MSKTDNLKYMEIYNHFLGLIRAGVLVHGNRLPSESQLANQFEVSRITVIRALNQLQDDGFISRAQGRGSFVHLQQSTPQHLAAVALIMSISGKGREIQMIQGIEMRLKQAGYVLTIHNSQEHPEVERELVVSMKNKVHGMILYPANSIDNAPLFEGMMKEMWPIVYIDRYPMNIPCSFVACDNVDGGYQLGRHFIDAGHKQIALIYHDIVGLTSERDRFNGFMRAMSEGNIPRSNIKILSINRTETMDTVNRILHELYLSDRNPDHYPSAIFTFNDSLALLMMACIQRHPEYQLPANFLLGGFDDLKGSPRSVPFVTIRQDYNKIGEAAASLLLEKMESKILVSRQEIVPVQLIHYPVDLHA